MPYMSSSPGCNQTVLKPNTKVDKICEWELCKLMFGGSLDLPVTGLHCCRLWFEPLCCGIKVWLKITKLCSLRIFQSGFPLVALRLWRFLQYVWILGSCPCTSGWFKIYIWQRSSHSGYWVSLVVGWHPVFVSKQHKSTVGLCVGKKKVLEMVETTNLALCKPQLQAGSCFCCRCDAITVFWPQVHTEWADVRTRDIFSPTCW